MRKDCRGFKLLKVKGNLFLNVATLAFGVM